MPRKKAAGVAADAKLRRAQARSTERALAEERLALAAITKVLLLEVEDPTRVLARLDAMTRAAEQDRRVPANVRRRLLDASSFVRQAIERERGQGTTQTLFDPPKPAVRAAAVDRLVAPTDGPQQLGFVGNESILGDVEEAHDERVATIAAVQDAVIELLRGPGAATDRELYVRYVRAKMIEPCLPFQGADGVADRRRELTAAGRLVRAGTTPDGTPRWDVVERHIVGEVTG